MRLIDADKLIEDMRNLAKRQISNCPNIAEFFVSIRVDRIIDILNSQPTTFNVDKVVSELETRRKEYENEADKIDVPLEYSCYFKGIMRGYEYSIDVVKAGGIDE